MQQLAYRVTSDKSSLVSGPQFPYLQNETTYADKGLTLCYDRTAGSPKH